MADKVESYVSHADAVQAYSKELQEPDWMLQLRLEALDKIDDLQEPRIERLRYNRWPLWQLPNLEAGDQASDIDYTKYVPELHTDNIVVQAGNQSVVEELPQSLKDKGVVFTAVSYTHLTLPTIYSV